ncbi:MAG: magnesium protoporphyrin IX methyltransferase [Halieaceae bacterium]|jgi:magnesium-protoporphyrin O-methyltransferase|nr:magnesium protoporphyrin IX methyltransferase [Halieaceae bacterium]
MTAENTLDTYEQRRSEIRTYFDQTAADAWSKLTSDAPVSRIRQTVRAGRDEMRSTLLDWLPQDLSGRTVLDAGCGTGALAVEAAMRGARVVATDLSPTLVELAGSRVPAELQHLIEFRVGDMTQTDGQVFDHIVAMDSLIHYDLQDVLASVSRLSRSARRSIVFTFAPRTPLLAAMHNVGKLFPRSNRSPAIQPVAERALQSRLANDLMLAGWRLGRQRRVSSGFYTSQAQELESF